MQKTIISLFKGGSAVIYVLIFCLVLSAPVIFIYQAVKTPEFTFETVSVDENFKGDEVIAEDYKDWQKIQFSLTATAGKFSPYSYEISEFKADGIEKEHIIVLDEPILCDKDTVDPFTLTIYIKGNTDVNEVIKSVSFKASDFSKSFGEFELKFKDGKAQFFK